MRLGEIIVNTCATLLLMSIVAILFLLFGEPLWPERTARMVIILPVDRSTTAAIKNTHQPLPASFDVSIVPARPTNQ
ncbi:polymerase [Mesorhizobium sp. M0488]|uniref:polymerase n=1 Tax=unclassified Mesorhizobium TaxID=325217 RepID=UPI0033397250